MAGDGAPDGDFDRFYGLIGPYHAAPLRLVAGQT